MFWEVERELEIADTVKVIASSAMLQPLAIAPKDVLGAYGTVAEIFLGLGVLVYFSNFDGYRMFPLKGWERYLVLVE